MGAREWYLSWPAVSTTANMKRNMQQDPGKEVERKDKQQDPGREGKRAGGAREEQGRIENRVSTLGFQTIFNPPPEGRPEAKISASKSIWFEAIRETKEKPMSQNRAAALKKSEQPDDTE